MNSESFSTHIVFDELDTIQEFFNSEDLIENISLEDILYFKSAISFIIQRLNLVMPELIQDSELSNINNEITSAISHVQHFINNKNANHIEQAKNIIKNAISKARILPLILEKSDFSFSIEASNFSSTIKKEYQKIEEINKNVKSKVETLETDIEEKKKLIDDLSEAIDKKDSEIQDLNSRFELEFQRIKDENTNNFHINSTAQKEEFNSTRQDLIEEIGSLRNGLGNTASEIISDLESMKEEARKLVGLVGETAVTGNYQKIANEHKKSANNWRRIAAVCMFAFSIILIYTIWGLNSEDLEWQKALIRIIAAVSLSYPATYAARESSKHRNLENINRKAELELAAINPFIELLPDEKKQKIKEDLVNKYFGNDNNTTVAVDEDMSIASFERILNAIGKLKNK